MSKEILGDACAFIRGINGDKNRYPRIGIAMKDGERISIKLDTIPIDKTWEGWINIFPRDEAQRPLQSTRPSSPTRYPNVPSTDFPDDDIPF